MYGEVFKRLRENSINIYGACLANRYNTKTHVAEIQIYTENFRQSEKKKGTLDSKQ